jgi:hypothetical protein
MEHIVVSALKLFQYHKLAKTAAGLEKSRYSQLIVQTIHLIEGAFAFRTPLIIPVFMTYQVFDNFDFSKGGIPSLKKGDNIILDMMMFCIGYAISAISDYSALKECKACKNKMSKSLTPISTEPILN